MRRAAHLVAVIAGAVAVVAASPAVPAGAAADDGISIRLLDAPVDRQDDPRARLYVVDHVHPAGVVDRRVEVVNRGTEPVTVHLYADGAAVDGRGFTFTGDDELSSWTSVDPPTLTLAPGAAGHAAVRVEVPANVPDGVALAVVWAELPATTSGGVRTVNRVGVRMYLSVGAGSEPATDFEITTITPRRDDDGRPVIDAEVVNTGGRALDLAGELSLLDGPGGTSAGPFVPGAASTVGVGHRGSVTVALDPALPEGPWRVELSLRSGTVVREAAAVITFPTAAGAAGDAVEALPPDVARSPFTFLAALLVIAVVLAMLWFLRRRRGDDGGVAPVAVAYAASR
jgi:hypothetical protein